MGGGFSGVYDTLFWSILRGPVACNKIHPMPFIMRSSFTSSIQLSILSQNFLLCSISCVETGAVWVHGCKVIVDWIVERAHTSCL